MMENKLGAITYKEIYEQGKAFQGINNKMEEIFATFDRVFEENPDFDQVIFTGCGTSLYLAQTSAFAFSKYNKISVQAVPCSELYFYPDAYLQGKKTLVIPITRRSDTSEVRMAIHKVREYPNVKTLSVTCDENSKTYNDYYVLSPDAKEKSVVMTKSFTSMVYMNMLLALYIGKQQEEIEKIKKLPQISEEFLPLFDQVTKQIVEENKDLNLFITLGQGAFYGIANECMNKIKEMAIANSEAYQSLEYRHGPMALVDSNTLIVFLMSPETDTYEEKLMKQMKGMGAKVVCIGDTLSEEVKQESNYVLELKKGLTDIGYAPLVGLVGQFLGYHLAVKKGLDLDAPRNLSQAIIL